MALPVELRQKTERIRDYLYGGGYPDPVSNAEQLSFLFFFYMMEVYDAQNKQMAEVTNRAYTSYFDGTWKLQNSNANALQDGHKEIPCDHLKWSVFARALTGMKLVTFIRDEVFPFIADRTKRADEGNSFFDGAQLLIQEPTVLAQVVTMVDELRLENQPTDIKGDLYEEILKNIRKSGELGQFRTPRHIIRMIVSLVDPLIGETVYDPAAGTAGFLAAAFDHIQLKNSDPDTIEEIEHDGKTYKHGYGDYLDDREWYQLRNETFYGNDVDGKMVRLSSMNLMLRGLENVRILHRNVLTDKLEEEERNRLGVPRHYDVILTNPPFSGKLDENRIINDVKVGTTKATELLFLKYVLQSLRPAEGERQGGRCGIVVPEGVLFGSTSAHKELRKQLLENNTVHAVISLPSGVFQPYSGVKTSVLVFTKGGKTERVWFYEVKNDGYKLDAQHNTPIDADDLPDVNEQYSRRADSWSRWKDTILTENMEREQLKMPPVSQPSSWNEKYWWATLDEIRKNDYNLSAGRYKPHTTNTVQYDPPDVILRETLDLEEEIMDGLKQLLIEMAGKQE